MHYFVLFAPTYAILNTFHRRCLQAIYILDDQYFW